MRKLIRSRFTNPWKYTPQDSTSSRRRICVDPWGGGVQGFLWRMHKWCTILTLTIISNIFLPWGVLSLRPLFTPSWPFPIREALDKCNIIPNFFQKKVEIFIPLEVLAWIMTACWVLCSRLIYFWRNRNISSIFYFSKSTSINTLYTWYSSLLDTLKMMLFTKYLVKWKRIGRISWKFQYWIDLKSSKE